VRQANIPTGTAVVPEGYAQECLDVGGLFSASPEDA
jgi:hypothetical protein